MTMMLVNIAVVLFKTFKDIKFAIKKVIFRFRLRLYKRKVEKIVVTQTSRWLVKKHSTALEPIMEERFELSRENNEIKISDELNDS